MEIFFYYFCVEATETVLKILFGTGLGYLEGTVFEIGNYSGVCSKLSTFETPFFKLFWNSLLCRLRKLIKTRPQDPSNTLKKSQYTTLVTVLLAVVSNKFSWVKMTNFEFDIFTK